MTWCWTIHHFEGVIVISAKRYWIRNFSDPSQLESKVFNFFRENIHSFLIYKYQGIFEFCSFVNLFKNSTLKNFHSSISNMDSQLSFSIHSVIFCITFKICIRLSFHSSKHHFTHIDVACNLIPVMFLMNAAFSSFHC